MGWDVLSESVECSGESRSPRVIMDGLASLGYAAAADAPLLLLLTHSFFFVFKQLRTSSSS